jgi:hypothetical protein
MHFSLGTLLIAMTAAAVYIGGFLALFRTMAPGSASSSFALVHATCGLPIFVLWCVAGEWAFRRRSLASSARLMLAAILIAAAWRLCSPFAQALFFRFVSLNSGNVEAVQWYSAVSSLLHGIFEFASWLLMTFAVVQGMKAMPEPDQASPWEPETLRE